MLLKSDKDLKTDLKASEFELLVPANNKNIAIKAIKAGADAVYIGYSRFGARVQAGNSMEDLIELIDEEVVENKETKKVIKGKSIVGGEVLGPF